MFVFDRRNY